MASMLSQQLAMRVREDGSRDVLALWVASYIDSTIPFEWSAEEAGFEARHGQGHLSAKDWGSMQKRQRAIAKDSTPASFGLKEWS